MQDKLSNNFIIELFAHAFAKKTTMDAVVQHLKFSYLQREEEKKLWQYVINIFQKRGKIPTVGQMYQEFELSNGKVAARVIELLDKISDVEDIQDEESHLNCLQTFESYIKTMMFLDANDKMAEAYNRNDSERAYGLVSELAEKMNGFSLTTAKFSKVFADFKTRQAQRKSAEYQRRFRVPTGIDELDFRLGGKDGGGPESGECVLWLGDSGMGKSQALVHMGISSVRQGYRTVHFQLEGTQEQCFNRYDAAWTGTLYHDMKNGNASPDAKQRQAWEAVIKKLSKKDIIVSTEEEFGGKSLADVRRELAEIVKTEGPVECVLIDYLELLEVGDGIRYSPNEERFRQQKLARGMKMIAMEFNCVVHTATQSSNVPFDKRNDPAFVITRDELSEDKGKIRPFDIFITLNQTLDEKRDSTMRLHTDKLRDYGNGEPIHICTNFGRSRFYDRQRTLNMDWDEYGQ